MKIKLLHTLGEFLSRKEYVKKAIIEHADLSEFKQKPTPRVIAGLLLIGISYLLGWPAVGLCGYLAYYYNQPLIVIIGGPVIYGLSHGVFWLGIFLAGIEYTKIFFRWGTRIAVEHLLRF